MDRNTILLHTQPILQYEYVGLFIFTHTLIPFRLDVNITASAQNVAFQPTDTDTSTTLRGHAEPRRLTREQATKIVIAARPLPLPAMPFPFIDTPRTEPDANATYLRSGGAHGLSVLDSVENSFQSPTRENDLVRIVGNGGTARRREHENGTDAAAFNNNKTPRATAATVRSTRNARHPRNSTTAAPRGEFTPMLNSVMKNNPGVERSVRRRQSLETPMAARGYANGGRIDVSNYHDGSDDNDATPVPQASSSILGTPLSRVAPGNVLGEGQMMTLKEQEKVC